MTHIIDKIRARRRRHRRTSTAPAMQKNPRGVDLTSSSDSGVDDGFTAAGVSTTAGTETPLSLRPLFYSFEFFPPKTEAGVENLLTRIDRMVTRLDPLFIDVTFSTQSYHRTLSLATLAQRYCNIDVLLHLTCQGMTEAILKQVLNQAQGSGIHNLLVLRGDPPFGQDRWQPDQVVEDGDFPRAIDLVKYIRREFGSAFGIAVAGHPEGHSSSSFLDELQHLKEKIDAGADVILTQFFYNVDVFLDFVRNCRKLGIHAPILPGIMPIQSYSSFTRMTKYCGISVPDDLMQQVEAVQTDDEAVKEIGCQVATEMCQRILEHQESLELDGIHFYTLNLERSATRILVDLGVVDVIHPTQPEPTNNNNPNGDPASSERRTSTQHNSTQLMSSSPSQLADAYFRTSTDRPLPWRPSAMEKRAHMEQVRPINWANRPKSYVMRTEDWDEFPNGRWGDAASPAFGELSDLSHFYSFSLGSSDDEQRNVLGHNPRQPQDVYEVFAQYVEGRIPHIPWCETPLQAESFLIQNQLAQLNRSGFLTINSQPAVNGVPSTHKTFGWGGPNGYVYQKAYCECFCSPDHASKLIAMVQSHPSLNLYAVNHQGNELRTGSTELDGITALTWGVFPSREILQPTVFDPHTYLVWAEEAFSLWSTMWLRLYDMESESYDLIETIRDTYYLCAIIDNDYITNNANTTNNGHHNGNGGAAAAAADQTSSLWKAMLESLEN